MIFKKGTTRGRELFQYQDQNISCVNTYNYLGVTLQSNGKFHETRKCLAEKASRAMYTLLKTMPRETDCRTFLHLFEICIKPILLYGSPTWGHDIIDNNRWDNTPTEQLHLKFCKRILGVNKFSSNAACRAELGEFPLLTDIQENLIKYWYRISDLPDNNITKQAFQEQKELNLHWFSTVKNIVTKNTASLSSATPQKLPPSKIKHIRNNIRQRYIDLWMSNVANNKKLRTYIKFKNSYTFEPYLFQRILKHKIIMTRFRISSHVLEIEKGRHTQPKTPLEDRICKHCCQNKIENEEHFFMECPSYQTERQKFFNSINIPEVLKSDDQIFKYIMSSREDTIISQVGEYLYTLFEIRNRND